MEENGKAPPFQKHTLSAGCPLSLHWEAAEQAETTPGVGRGPASADYGQGEWHVATGPQKMSPVVRVGLGRAGHSLCGPRFLVSYF